MLLPLDLLSKVQFLRLLVFYVDKLAFSLLKTSFTCKGFVAVHHHCGSYGNNHSKPWAALLLQGEANEYRSTVISCQDKKKVRSLTVGTSLKYTAVP